MASTENTLTDYEVEAIKELFRPVTYMLVEDLMEEGKSMQEAWEHMLSVKPEDVNGQQEQLMKELFEDVWNELEN